VTCARGRRNRSAGVLCALSEKDTAATDATASEGAAAGEEVEVKDCPYGFSKAARAMDSAKQAVYNALMGSSVPMTKEEVAAAGAAADPNVGPPLFPPSNFAAAADGALHFAPKVLDNFLTPERRHVAGGEQCKSVSYRPMPEPQSLPRDT